MRHWGSVGHCSFLLRKGSKFNRKSDQDVRLETGSRIILLSHSPGHSKLGDSWNLVQTSRDWSQTEKERCRVPTDVLLLHHQSSVVLSLHQQVSVTGTVPGWSLRRNLASVTSDVQLWLDDAAATLICSKLIATTRERSRVRGVLYYRSTTLGHNVSIIVTEYQSQYWTFFVKKSGRSSKSSWKIIPSTAMD